MKRTLLCTALLTLLQGCVGTAPQDSRRVEVSPGVYSIADAQNARRVVDVIDQQQVRCQRRRSIGSNMTRKRCQTVAEEKELRELDQKELQDYLRRQNSIMTPSFQDARFEPGNVSPGGG